MIYSSGSQFILKPVPCPEGKIIFAPLAPFNALFFILSHLKKPLSHPLRTADVK